MVTPGDLHEPVLAGRLALRNRIVMPAHTTNYAVDGGFSARHRAYHRARAAGGAGLIITEGMRVHATSLGRTTTVSAAEDAITASLAALVETVHGEGAKLAAQLLHVGRQAGSHLVLTPPWGASPIPWSPTAAVPHEMTGDEIATVVAAFGAAAARVAAAGVDAVEVHLGHGHLLQQFLSPATNHRTDGYGGSLTNRLRFAREALDAVTAAAPGLPVVLRISGDEFLPGGLDLDAMLSAMHVLLADHPVDLLHVSHSAYVATASIATQMADMSFPPMPFRHLPRAFKEEFPGLSVLAVGRVDDLDNARALVADGDADLVALARPHIAVPDLVVRDRDGDTTPVRECIACNQGCAGRLELGLPISCVVNPEAGLEREWAALRAAARAGPDLRVLVVGGGPAGMEAALAAASAGHRVTLVEAEPELGGALRFAARLPVRARFSRYVDQLAASVRHAGVEVRLGTSADPALLGGDGSGDGWDHVIVATGARDTTGPADHAFPVLPLRQAVSTPDAAGAHVVLVDEDGTTTALALADLLLSRGRRVTLVTDRAALAWRVPVYSRPALLDRLRNRGFSAVLMRAPVRMSDGDLICADPLSGQEQRIAAVDTVVPVRAPVAAAVRANGGAVVGDAYTPRTALEAAFEGRLSGLAAARTAEVRAAESALRGRL